MKLLKYIFPLIAISVLITAVVLKCFSLADHNKAKLYNLETLNEINKSKYSSLLRNEYLRIENEGMIINESVLIYGENDSTNFQELLSDNKNILVFRYSELNCMVCVDKEVLILKRFMKETDLKIIILATYSNMRDLYLFKRINQIPNAEVYNIRDQQLGLPIEKINIPYYFVTDTSFKARNFFVPDKLIPERSIKYLKSLANY